jgi:hypothetical protein
LTDAAARFGIRCSFLRISLDGHRRTPRLEAIPPTAARMRAPMIE